jgi:LacI family transcriptional regulator
MKKNGIPEIARMANVSIGTVGRALLDRKGVSKSTRERILSIAEAVGYKPNLAARALSKGRAQIRVGVCIPRELHYYFDQLRDGILDEAHRFEHLGIELNLQYTERLGVGEVDRVSGLVAEGVQAVIIAPGDPEGLVPVINEAECRAIRVICVDSDVQASSRSTVVSVDAEVSGRLAAELMGRFLDPGAEVAMITGMPNVELHRQKAAGFRELFPQICKGGKVVETVDTLDDEDDPMRKCFALLERRRFLSGIYVRTGNCLPICRAISVLGLTGKITLIATDLFREMIPYFENGAIHASINGRPYMQGQIAMRLLVDHLARGHSLPSCYRLNPQVVLRSNLHLFPEARPKTAGSDPAGLVSARPVVQGVETRA